YRIAQLNSTGMDFDLVLAAVRRSNHHCYRPLAFRTQPVRHHGVINVPAVGFAFGTGGARSRTGHPPLFGHDMARQVSEHLLPLAGVSAFNPDAQRAAAEGDRISPGSCGAVVSIRV